MRVCHIWHSFIPIDFGGVERYILSLSDFLSTEKNVDFTLITDRAAYVSFLCSLRLAGYQRINSLNVRRIGPNLSSILNSANIKFLHRSQNALSEMLTTNLYRQALKTPGIEKVDVFHVHGFWQPLYPKIGLRLSKRFNRPFVVTLHGDSIDPKDRFSMPLRNLATLEVLREAGAITTFAKETFNALGELGLGKKSYLIPNFINSGLFKRPDWIKNNSGTKIVIISRLSKPKDPITPIRAFALVKKEIPEATLQIVGYGPLFEYANRLVHDLGLDGSVTFVGMQSNVRKFMWDSDIIVGTRGSYITTLEAWAAGIVVVAPRFGIMKEIISDGETGFLTTPENIKELAAVLLNLIRNKTLRERIASNALYAVEKHDINKIGPVIYNLYRSLI
jgi:glycosyltransferase involved in cell wall biosynthesis